MKSQRINAAIFCPATIAARHLEIPASAMFPAAASVPSTRTVPAHIGSRPDTILHKQKNIEYPALVL